MLAAFSEELSYPSPGSILILAQASSCTRLIEHLDRACMQTAGAVHAPYTCGLDWPVDRR
jgi:hypothetical protein